MVYVVIARDGADPEAKERRLRVRPSHLAGITPLVDDGRVLLGGALLDDAGDMVGSVLLVDFSTRAELDAWLEGDPYVTEGVWTQVEVRPFRPSVGAWIPDA